MSDDVELPGGVRYHPETLKRLERERDEARAKAKTNGQALDSATRAYFDEKDARIRAENERDKARKERDKLATAYNTCCDNWANTRRERDTLKEALERIVRTDYERGIPSSALLVSWAREALAALEEA